MYLFIIFIIIFSGISLEPCNHWHYLGHVKHVDDDDDDDDAALLHSSCCLWVESI